MMSGRFWPSNEHVIRVVVFGPDALAAERARVLDAALTRTLTGRAADIRWGEPADPALRFAGDAGPQQNFAHLAAPIPAPRAGFNQALPATAPTVGANNDVLDLLRRTRR